MGVRQGAAGVRRGHGQGVRDHDYAVTPRVVTDVDAHRTERLSEETRIPETIRSVDNAHARCDG